MDTLLTIAVVVIALAIIAQAGVLIAMYLMSRRLARDVDSLVADGRQLIPPLESVTTNLKSVSEDLAAAGKSAREQVHRVETKAAEARDVFLSEVDRLRERITETVEEVREAVLDPVNQWSALTRGLVAACRTFVFGKQTRTEEDREHPAA